MATPKASVSMSGTAKTKRPPVNRIPAPGTKTGYRAVDKDPDMQILVGHILDSGWPPERIEAETIRIGRKVSRHCITGWIYDGVRRPQNYTMTSVAMALGIARTWARQPSAKSLALASSGKTAVKAAVKATRKAAEPEKTPA